ncbi:hypothetical protein [Nodosilinea nodulosa]|nr:hypothetical protein [Nodosilinea nodulosa]
MDIAATTLAEQIAAPIQARLLPYLPTSPRIYSYKSPFVSLFY